jgi:hypothetical protein
MAAFYYGSDSPINEETGEEYTTEELIAIGRAERAEMAREEMAQMDADDQAWDDQAMAEVNAQNEVEGREFYTLADLIHAVSGDDVNGMKTTTYRSWAEDLIDTTENEDRKVFYRTGNLTGTLAEYEAWYTR